MQAKRVWAVQSLLTCFFWNAVLIAVFFYMAKQTLVGFHQWVDPFLAPGAESLSENLQAAFTNVNQLLADMERYLAPVLFGTGALSTFVLWLFVLLQGRRLANRVQRQMPAAEPAAAKAVEAEAVVTEATPPAEPQYVQASPQAAVQMLAVLQREGRLVDFLEEDLTPYDDAQIGAAVRSIHEGCRKAMTEYVELSPIFEEQEGARVTVPADFDSRAIRLTGNVKGDPPFAGALRHRGWRVARVQLPQPTSEQSRDWVLAPAEVEIEE